LEGNSRIETLLFEAIGKPQGRTNQATTQTWQAQIGVVTVFYMLPLLTSIYLIFTGILSTQPILATVTDSLHHTVRFPQTYLVFRNGLRHKLFGSLNGTIHGRVPHEQATLVI